MRPSVFGLTVLMDGLCSGVDVAQTLKPQPPSGTHQSSVIVAGEGATFQDVAHFGAGVAPGDGIFTTWSYRAGAGRAEAFLLNPQPLPARTAREWGVVAEVVPNGKAFSRARELAELYLKARR